MKSLFVVNERSGARRNFDVAGVIRATALAGDEIVPCGQKEDLAGLIDRAERDSFDVVYAVGGDGTVHETARHLIGRGPALGILPIGSGNGFARHIGLPLEPAEAIRASRGGSIINIDTAEANGHPFLSVMGVGFDALVAERFASSNVRGLKTYVVEGATAFLRFRAEEYEIAIGGATLRKRAFVVAVANAGQYGNNARIAPLASLRDGLLDIVIVDDTSPARAMLLLPALFRGTLHRERSVTTLQAAELTIRRPAPGPAHLDGEPDAFGPEIRVQVVPKSLRVLVPAGAERL